MELDWRLGGNPLESGYYLAAWTAPSGKKIVSELWFNPSSLGTGWWATRGYIDQNDARPYKTIWNIHVTAWMPMPEHPGKEGENARADHQ